MRRPSDLPRRRGLFRFPGRSLVIGLGAVVFVLLPLVRAGAHLYIDYLWYRGLGRTDVYRGILGAKATMFGAGLAGFALLAGVNLFIADRLAPSTFPAKVHPLAERFHQIVGRRTRMVRYGVAALLALAMAAPAARQWQTWLLFRNRQSFGRSDPQFGVDVGFYVFELPFFEFVLNWLFIAMFIVLVLVALTHVLNGGVMFASALPSVRGATKGHLAVLLAVLALLRAASYWVSRYSSTNDRRGFVQGATYAVVHAQLPALILLSFIAAVTAALYLWSVRTGSWRLPVIASGVWAVMFVFGGVVVPSAVQALVVRPNQQSREEIYLARNIDATRVAMGIDDEHVTRREISFEPLDASDIEAGVTPLTDVRLLNPIEFRSRFQVDRGDAAGLAIGDLDVDRYEVDGRDQQVLVAARELDISGIANKSWQGRHLINTRGCGIVMASSSEVLQSDSPDYQALDIDRPELYFSPTLTNYAIAGTSETENDCDGLAAPYSGEAGVELSSFGRRAAFALAFLDYNLLGSGAIDDSSQLLWVRDVSERVAKLAPFLTYDGDPYPVVVGGKVYWVIDAFTSTSRYPYAQRIGDSVQLTSTSNLDRDSNYVRNSVKAVVDAYDGTVHFYANDPDDPILQAWDSAFGDLFSPMSEMPDGLSDHLRYPEDLFRVQTDLYSKYQLDTADFFERDGAWSVAQAPSVEPRQAVPAGQLPAQPPAGDGAAVNDDFAQEATSGRFVPYYTYFSDPVTAERSFVIIRPFVPFSSDDARTELQAYMTASNAAGSGGRLVVYGPSGDLPAGPLRVAQQIESDPPISREITLQNQSEGGSQVRFGDLQIVPITNDGSTGLLWVRPFYVSVTNVTYYRFVIVNYDGRSAIAESLTEALTALFPDLDVNIGDRVGAPPPDETVSSTPGPGTQDTTPDGSASDTPEELLARADSLLQSAEADLRDTGDLGAYQAAVREASGLIARALDLLDAD